MAEIVQTILQQLFTDLIKNDLLLDITKQIIYNNNLLYFSIKKNPDNIRKYVKL